MHAPISIINPKAKLYKRFTPERAYELTKPNAESTQEPADIDNTREIVYEDNIYRTFFSFRFEEADDQTDEDEDSDGIVAKGSHKTIKYNGKYKVKKNSPCEPDGGDIVAISGELWQVKSVQRIKHKSLINFATVYLTLEKSYELL